jgi:hypothetical protein
MKVKGNGLVLRDEGGENLRFYGGVSMSETTIEK